MPRITTLIRSSEITVERKRRKAKIKKPLKRIKTWLMRSNRLRTHRSAKILHGAAIFGCLCSEKWLLNTVGSHFEHPAAILKPQRSAFLIVGKQKSVPKTGNRSSRSEIPPFKTSFCDHFCDRKKLIVMWIRH